MVGFTIDRIEESQLEDKSMMNDTNNRNNNSMTNETALDESTAMGVAWPSSGAPATTKSRRDTSSSLKRGSGGDQFHRANYSTFSRQSPPTKNN